ncbi:uncharacterized protein [Clytia hemisphaerica]|uniref:uncharacterized protein n=1 Tax=Clytia hemisphaerica TaxID=252671 RepID=UPI0034D6A792
MADARKMADKAATAKKPSPKDTRVTRNSSSSLINRNSTSSTPIKQNTPKKHNKNQENIDTEISTNQTKNNNDDQLSPSQQIFKQNEEIIRQNQEIFQQNQNILQRMTNLELSTDRRINELVDALTDMKGELKGVIDSQDFINKEHEKQKLELSKVETKIKSLSTDSSQHELNINRLKNGMNNTERSITDLHFLVNDLEQYGRREMINISGVPRKNNENTDNIVLDIANKIGVELEVKHIAASHRTSSKRTAPIIVKFTSRRYRNQMWEARWNLKNVKTTEIGFNENNSIYFNESLTDYNRKIFKQAWDKLKIPGHCDRVTTENGITYAWQTHNKEHKSEKMILRDEYDITNLIPKNKKTT